MCEEVFQQYSEYERIEKFSRPQLLRLLDILRLYRPPVPPVSATTNNEVPENRVANNQKEVTESVQVLKGTEPVQVQEGTGSVQVKEVTESVRVHEGTGSVQVKEVTESVQIQEGIGSAQIQEVTGSIQIQEVVESVQIQQTKAADLGTTATSTLPVFSRRRRPEFVSRFHRNRDDVHQLCGIVFVERRTTAKLLYHLLKVFKIEIYINYK